MSIERNRYSRFRHDTPSEQLKFLTRYEFEGPELQDLIQQNPDVFHSHTLDLSQSHTLGNPLVINQPGRALCLLGYTTASQYDPATNTGLEVPERSAFIHCRINFDRAENGITLRHNRGFRGSYTKLFLSWPTQAGVSAKLHCYTFDEKPWEGDNDTNFNRLEASQLVTSAVQTVSTAALLLPFLPTRKVSTIQNQGSISIYIGDANVTDSSGGFPGTEIPPAGYLFYRNIAALYAVAAGGGPNANISINTES